MPITQLFNVMNLKFFLLLTSTLLATIVFGQHPETKSELDSLYINEMEEKPGRPKLLHAEPLFIDLIRDLGARKGEKEWNFGFGLTDRARFDQYAALVEYEFAPVDRLGLEIEVPFTFYIPLPKSRSDSLPSGRVESIKTAIQWTCLVSEKAKISLALGYINELKFSDIRGFDFRRPFMSNVFNPFVVAAKRWGSNFHTLLYTGPHVELPFQENDLHINFQINTNFHYMIRGTRNFIGVELNKQVWSNQFDMVVRPQIRLGITDNLLLGIVSGIPINRQNERYSFFTRLIYEPGHKVGYRPRKVKNGRKHI